MIQITSVSKEYNNIKVLDIPSLSILKGESFGVVGNNGAGKTTLFRIILDLISCTQGYVEIDGKRIARQDDWKLKVGSFLDEGFLIDFLRPEEYFNFVGKLHNMSIADIEVFLSKYQEFFNGEILGKDKLIRDLSTGNKKKIGIIASLIGNPEILILDEPFTVLDPSTQIRLKRILNNLVENENMSILISSHDLNHLTEVCKRIVLLEKGLIIKDLHTNSDTLMDLEKYFAV